MSYSKENLLQLYIEGNMPSEARAEFDRLVKEDPSFSGSLVDALSRDIGPSPDTVLNRMTADLDARYDQIWKTASGHRVPKVALPTMPALRLPTMRPEVLMVAGGLTLFGALAFFALTNPFQERVLSVEEQAIQGFRWVDPAPAAEKAVRPCAPAVKTARKAADNAAPSAVAPARKTAPELVPTGTSAASPKTAEELVALAMKSAPDGGLNQWVETSGTRARTPKALPPLPPLPGMDTSSPGVTERGDLLRLSVPMAQDDNVQVCIADSTGKIVRKLFSGYLKAGDHTFDWDVKDDKGNTLQAGEYNVVVSASGRTHMQKVTIK